MTRAFSSRKHGVELTDRGLGGGVIALKTFSQSFGITGTPTEIANLQGNVVSILQGGAFFGALGGGPVEERIGRKYALMVGCVIFIIGGIVQVAATNGISAGKFRRRPVVPGTER
jgi:MFS family permease